MAFDDYAVRYMRRKAKQGKRAYILQDNDTLAKTITDDRASLRLISRVHVAFFTPEELKQYTTLARKQPHA